MNILIGIFILTVTVASITNFWIKIILKKNGEDISFMNTGFSEYFKFNKFIKDSQYKGSSYSILFYSSLISLVFLLIIFITIVVKMITNLPS
jgi:hypothetical protein